MREIPDNRDRENEFAERLMKLRPQVCSIAGKLLYGYNSVPAGPDDIFQESAIKVLKSYRAELIRSQLPVCGFFVRTAIRTTLDHIRKARRYEYISVEDVDTLLSEGNGGYHATFGTELLNMLHPKYRNVILLQYSGYSTKEISDILQIPENTAKVMAHRARKRVRRIVYSVEATKVMGIRQ